MASEVERYAFSLPKVSSPDQGQEDEPRPLSAVSEAWPDTTSRKNEVDVEALESGADGGGARRREYQQSKDESSSAAAAAETDSNGNNKSTTLWKRVWQTRFTVDTKSDKALQVKTTIRELITYLVYLTILCIVTYGMVESTAYFYTKAMKELFVDVNLEPDGDDTFLDIQSMADFWTYAEGPLLDGLYWEEWYNNKTFSDDELGYIYHENKLLGLPRLRMLRVRSDSCSVAEDFADEITSCYASYSRAIENTSSFGLINGTAWTYHTENELDTRSYWGLLATYGGGGFPQLLNSTKVQANKAIGSLKENLWMDRGTRVVFIDFSVYNANINLFCVVKLVVEFPPSGGAFASSTLWSIKLLRYVTSYDYFVMACEILFVIATIYYTIEEILEAAIGRMKYLKSIWNWLDILMLLLSYVVISFGVYRTITVNSTLDSLLSKPGQHADFETLAFWQMQYNYIIAILVFFAWFKLFKYISFNKTMNQLSSTLSKCAKDVLGFCIMFFIVFFAYAQLGYLIFGAQVKDFSTFGDSIFTLFRIILGDFDFLEMEKANRILGPIFFVTYVFFVFFVLLNMFLAIINDSYSDVKGDTSEGDDEFRISDYLLRGFEKLKEKLRFKKNKITEMQSALETADADNDNEINFEEWRSHLKNRGHSDADIETSFAKHDLDKDRILTANEQKKMSDVLKQKKRDLDEEITAVDEATRKVATDTTGIATEDLALLSRRVDRLEDSLGSVISKLDSVLAKLVTLEQSQTASDSIEESSDPLSRLMRDELEKLEVTESKQGRERFEAEEESIV
eukprot:m.109041 g.109041  ORF g.109041 m.109041 type:complete len:797 (+) comp37336_c0_seq2:145-2535(+)